MPSKQNDMQALGEPEGLAALVDGLQHGLKLHEQDHQECDSGKKVVPRESSETEEEESICPLSGMGGSAHLTGGRRAGLCGPDDSEDENGEEEDDDEEEESIQSLSSGGQIRNPECSPDARKGGDHGLYTSKGPVRRGGVEQRPHQLGPYGRTGPVGSQPTSVSQAHKDKEDDDFDLISIGAFLDEIYPELSLAQSSPTDSPKSLHGSSVIPVMDMLDGAFDSGKSRILIKHDQEPSGFRAIPTTLSFVVDESHRRLGINIPRQAVPFDGMPKNLRNGQKLEICLQLDPRVPKIIKVKVHVEESLDDLGTPNWVIRSQFLRLQPFMGQSGLDILLHGVDSSQIERANNILAGTSDQELLKTHGPNKDTILMILCMQKDSPRTRSEILAVTRKILGSTDPKVRANILATNEIGSNAFECALLRNKPEVARYLAEIFYDLGVDLVQLRDVGKNTVLHVLARRGDDTAPALQTLLELRFHGNRRVFPSNLANLKGELPIHLVARNEKCHLRTIQLLAQDLPTCFTTPSSNGGALPLHYACQYSKDPNLLTALLHFNKDLVNVRRDDGCTPLHLVACRSDQESVADGLVALDEDAQIRMVRTLLEMGADATLKVDGFLPYDLVDERTRVRMLLKTGRRNDSGGSQHHSPTSRSPPNEFFPASRVQQMSPGMMSPSATSGIGSDLSSPYSQHHSPPNSDGYTSSLDQGNRGFYSPMSAGNQGGPGSVSSGSAGQESSGSDSEEGNNNLDAIAEAIYQQFPSIQEIMNADPELNN